VKDPQQRMLQGIVPVKTTSRRRIATVLLLEGSSVGEDADRVQARACAPPRRAREALRTSAFLSDRRET
jgi:hypothetical protein